MAESDRITVNILTPMRLEPHDIGVTFVELITSEFPFLSPDRYGNFEPLKTKYVPSQRNLILNAWENNIFIWKRSRPFVEGGVHFARGVRPVHSWITIDIGNGINTDDIVSFVQKAAVSFRADFATIHLMPPQEVAEILGEHASGVTDPKLLWNDPRRGLHRNVVTSNHLFQFVPNLYWATIFGKPYVDMLGCEKLLQSPLLIATALSNESVYLQISDDPFDFATKYDVMNEMRIRAKKYINHDVFYDDRLPLDHHYSVPSFVLEGYTREDITKYYGVN